jgi:diguanylate cyclase (GGDEF)-like protein
MLVVVRDERDPRRLAAIVDALAESTLLVDDGGLVSWQSGRLAGRLEGRPADADRAATTWTGIGVNPIERIHPEDLPTVLDSFAEVVMRPGRRLRLTVRSKAVDDDDRWELIEVNGSSHLEDPDLRGILVQVSNLDDGEHLDSLAETDGPLLSLTDAAPIGILVVDAWGRTVYQNTAARLLVGGDDGQGDAWYGWARPTDAAALRAAVAAALDGDEHTTVTAAAAHDAELRRWVRVRVSPRYADGHRTVGAIATLEDVTAEVLARAETERLTQMLDATSDYVAVFRPGGVILYVNRAVERTLEILRAEGAAGALEDLIDDEPRQAWIEAAVDALGADGTVWRGELPLNVGGGRTVPTSAIGVVHRAEDGTFDWIAMFARDISDLAAVQDQLRHLATHDVLTGLPNRSVFIDRLEEAVARHERHRSGVAVLFCDLDGFKAINDDRGHGAGDRVLRTVAARIRAVTGGDDEHAARVGGDEFVVVCEGRTDTDDLADLAEQLIAAIVQPIELDGGGTVKVGISVGIGVARARQRHADPDQLLSLADTAMYRAKARGGNRYRIAALDD